MTKLHEPARPSRGVDRLSRALVGIALVVVALAALLLAVLVELPYVADFVAFFGGGLVLVVGATLVVQAARAR